VIEIENYKMLKMFQIIQINDNKLHLQHNSIII